jgi:hypothetical protein
MRYRSLHRLIAVQATLVLAFFFATMADICSADDSALFTGIFSSEGPASSGELSAAPYNPALGSTVSAAQFSSMRCTPVQVTVGWMGAHSVTYYRCGTNWYTKAYSGHSVSYVMVKPPTGVDY